MGTAAVASVFEVLDASLVEAIATAALRSSSALAARLTTAESEVERLIAQKATRKSNVVTMPLQLDERLLRLVAILEIELARDVHKARTILRQLVGNEIPVVEHASAKHLVARIGIDMTELLQAVGASEIFLVVGARYAHSLQPGTASRQGALTHCRPKKHKARSHGPACAGSRHHKRQVARSSK